MASAQRILIADPDATTRHQLCQSCAAAGLQPHEAADGREALVKALVRPPALIAADLNLPLIDGFSLCAIIRRDRVTATVPFLAMAAHLSDAEVSRAERAGATAVVEKSGSIETLRAEMQRLLAISGELRARSRQVRAQAQEELDRANALLDRTARLKTAPLSRRIARVRTTDPPAPVPPLRCPECDQWLMYEYSQLGGVSERHAEQWDYFSCVRCGSFHYRHRTRKLRRVG